MKIPPSCRLQRRRWQRRDPNILNESVTLPSTHHATTCPLLQSCSGTHLLVHREDDVQAAADNDGLWVLRPPLFRAALVPAPEVTKCNWTHAQRAVTCHTSHVTRHTSHVTRHTSHVTRHTSHITRHTSHITRHTSHVTRPVSTRTSARTREGRGRRRAGARMMPPRVSA